MAIDFLEEYRKLQLKTPRLSTFILNSVNSDYCYNTKDSKNCYLIANAVKNENCMYGRDFYDNTDCVDCDHVKTCTLCYECLNCNNCYNCDYLQDSLNCNDCSYGYFLKGCRDCVGCVGLKQKRFYIFNVAYSEAEYRSKVAGLTADETAKSFEDLKRRIPRVYATQIDSENCSGDDVFYSRNINGAFQVQECQDGGYLMECKKVTDSWDITVLEQAELCYQISSCHVMHNCNFCFFCVECSDVEFGECLMSCQHCFGCISLHRKKYHILNEPYSAEEYFKKVAELKDQLREQGMYGQMLIPPTFPLEDTVVMMPAL